MPCGDVLIVDRAPNFNALNLFFLCSAVNNGDTSLGIGVGAGAGAGAAAGGGVGVGLSGLLLHIRFLSLSSFVVR